MAFQKILLKDSIAIADADTSYNCDLPRSAFIAAIIIRLYGTGGSGTPAVEDLITNFRVSASAPSETYYDIDSDEMRLRCKQLLSIAPGFTNATGAHTEINALMLFGRKLRDKRLMLDAAKHGTLSLNLTFSTLIATTAWATGTVKLDIEIIQWVAAKPGEHIGCIKSTHVKTEATGTNWLDVALPKGNAFDTIVAMVGTATSIDEIIFSIDNKKETPFHAKFINLLEANALEYEWATPETVQFLIDFCLEGSSREGDLAAAMPAPKDRDFELLIDRGATTSTVEVFIFEIVR